MKRIIFLEDILKAYEIYKKLNRTEKAYFILMLIVNAFCVFVLWWAIWSS
jgi:hypothetical protein